MKRRGVLLAAATCLALALGGLLAAPLASADEAHGRSKLQDAPNQPYDWIGTIDGYSRNQHWVLVNGRRYDTRGATVHIDLVANPETADTEKARRLGVGMRIGMVVAKGKPLRLREIWILPYE